MARKETTPDRKAMKYGFTAWTGVKFADSQVDAYNDIQHRINTFKRDLGYIPEYLINGSHNLFWSIARPTKKGWE